jgi:hypothetical protein
VPKSTPPLPVGGSPTDDLGGASDLGGGIDHGVPLTCHSDADCGGALCTGNATTTGVCLRVCSLDPSVGLTDVQIQRCIRGEECVELVKTIAVCLRPCRTAADCPDLRSRRVHYVCGEAFVGSGGFCVPEFVSTPSG